MNVGGRKDLLLAFSIAFVLILYEVFLSRFYSVVMEYHLVFLAMALATLGSGMAGFGAYRYAEWLYARQSLCLGIFALTLFVCVAVMYGLSYQGVWFYAILGLFPFGAGGLLLASIMQVQGERIRAIYFADLAGAGAGAAASIPLLNKAGPMQTVALVSALLLAMSLLPALRSAKKPHRALALILLGLSAAQVIRPLHAWIPFRAYMTSPSNIMSEESGARVVFSQWDAYSRTDVYDAGDGQLLYMTLDGGAVSPISKYAGNLQQVDYLRSTTGYLAFQGAGKERVLILGSGGGQDILAAELAGFRQIEAVDINAASFNAVRTLAAFSGNPYEAPGVTPIVSDGRSYIRQTRNRYDLVFLPLVKKASENGMALALTENYMFTQEAIGEYLSKLKPGGQLAFLLHDENELAKVMTASERVLKASGIPEASLNRHMAVIATYRHLGHPVWGWGGSRITRPLLLIRKEPVPIPEANELFASARRIGQIPIHVPVVYDRYSPLMQGLIRTEKGVSANRDDKPFFYHRSDGVPPSLVWTLAGVAGMVLILARTTRYAHGRALYFSGIAVGFMLLETTLVQRFILFLAHPALSFVIVLGTLLTAGGIGSLCSRKPGQTGKRYAPLLGIALCGIAVNAALTLWSARPLQISLNGRIGLAIAMLAPLGFFMGMAFPYGIGQSPKHDRALGWAFNGIMTAAGSLMAVILALAFGFAATMAIGSAIYGLLYLLQPSLKLDRM